MHGADTLAGDQVLEPLPALSIDGRQGLADQLAVIAILHGHDALAVLELEVLRAVDQLDFTVDDKSHA